MTIMTKPGAIIKIKILQNSNAKNYFETKERLFLQNILIEINKESDVLALKQEQIEELQKIYEKYKKFF